MSRVKRHISGFSDQEYLELVKKLAEQQYDSVEEDQDVETFSDWAEASLPEAYASLPTEDVTTLKKSRRVVPDSNVCLDLSRATMDVITQKLHTTGNIRVGPFIIRIKRYDASSDVTKLDVDLMEERVRQFNGTTGKMTEKVNMTKDSRFYNKSWSKFFTNPIKYGSKIPLETVAEIIKYLQFVFANPAFL